MPNIIPNKRTKYGNSTFPLYNVDNLVDQYKPLNLGNELPNPKNIMKYSDELKGLDLKNIYYEDFDNKGNSQGYVKASDVGPETLARIVSKSIISKNPRKFIYVGETPVATESTDTNLSPTVEDTEDLEPSPREMYINNLNKYMALRYPIKATSTSGKDVALAGKQGAGASLLSRAADFATNFMAAYDRVIEEKMNVEKEKYNASLMANKTELPAQKASQTQANKDRAYNQGILDDRRKVFKNYQAFYMKENGIPSEIDIMIAQSTNPALAAQYRATQEKKIKEGLMNKVDYQAAIATNARASEEGWPLYTKDYLDNLKFVSKPVELKYKTDQQQNNTALPKATTKKLPGE